MAALALCALMALGAFAGLPSPAAPVSSDAAPALQTPGEPLTIEAPRVLLGGVEREIVVHTGSKADLARAVEVRLILEGTTPVLLRRGFAAAGPRQSFKVVVPQSAPTGRGVLEAQLEGEGGEILAYAARGTRVLSPYWSFVPPLLAIGLALALRQVIPALLLGVFSGALIRTGFDPFSAALRVLDHDLVEALAESGDATKGHLKIVLFTLLLGGLVGVISRSGGAGGLVRAASRWARTRRSVQATGWLAGLLIFFDDYANTLVVGPAMRPLTDKLKVSREKLAFVVDATAAPLASIALISTWVGYEVGLIADALQQTGLAGQDPYSIFLASLPYRFYAWLMLAFVLLVAVMGRDFGSMSRAEARAACGEVLRAGSQPLSRTDLLQDSASAPTGQALLLALAPIVTIALVTFTALWSTGRAALAGATPPAEAGTAPALQVLTSLRLLGEVLGEAASFNALLYGAASGVLVALFFTVLFRRLKLSEAMSSFTDGIGAMSLAVVILTFAWMIGGVCEDLGTAQVAVGLIGEGLPLRFLPAAVFIVAGAISFATGSSWTTMAVLVPVALPLADALAKSAGIPVADAEHLLIAATGSVLTGAVFGDHCSPISDTTVMSSLAAGCDHIDHVRTQIPYALVVGGVSLLVGDLAVGFGMPPWLGLVVGVLLLAALLIALGRRPPRPAPDFVPDEV